MVKIPILDSEACGVTPIQHLLPLKESLWKDTLTGNNTLAGRGMKETKGLGQMCAGTMMKMCAGTMMKPLSSCAILERLTQNKKMETDVVSIIPIS